MKPPRCVAHYCIAIFLGCALFFETVTAVHALIPLSFLPHGKKLSFCGEPVPLELEDVRERLEKEFLLITQDRAQVILWLKRSRRYLTQIEGMLRDNKMPLDLQYVAVVESALLPHAGSSKGALGFWQFMDSVGEKYGLTITPHLDERRNLTASTGAAIRYLSTLREMLGSWTLAVAAYNMGENGLLENIAEQGTNDYYKLQLPLETQRFIFRILCVGMILSDPAAFGFDLNDEEYYPPYEGDTIVLSSDKQIPIRVVAAAAGTYFKMIRDLNPEIRGNSLPPGNYQLLIPKGTAAGFYPRFEELMAKLLAAHTQRIYTVKKGDSLTGIAEKFGVSLTSLLVWNGLDRRRPIQPGDRLTIYHPIAYGDINTDDFAWN